MERRRIARVATIVDLHSPNSDVEYWRSRPIEERIGAITELRQIFFEVTDEARPDIQKVCRVLKRS